MKENKSKKGIKEFFRKFIVSLKVRTNKIPQFVMLIAFVYFSVNLSNISKTTAFVNKSPMGLCSFVTMLFSILAFVCSLNAFPKRSKPKLPMLILMYAMQVLIIGSDIWYSIRLNEGLTQNSYRNEALAIIEKTSTVITVHYILVIVTVVLFALLPVLHKLINKIDTSVDLGEDQKMGNIDLEDE